MTYEIRYEYNGEQKQGGFSIEAARTFAKNAARYAGKCEILEGNQVIEVHEADQKTGQVALSI